MLSSLSQSLSCLLSRVMGGHQPWVGKYYLLPSIVDTLLGLEGILPRRDQDPSIASSLIVSLVVILMFSCFPHSVTGGGPARKLISGQPS